MSANMLASALALADRGLPVFPCSGIDKRPLTRRGFREATSDPERIARWWWYGALVGVPTGEPSGISVVDIDPRHAGDRWLDQHRERLPETGSTEREAAASISSTGTSPACGVVPAVSRPASMSVAPAAT